MINIEELINLGEERLILDVLDIKHNLLIRNHIEIRHNNITIPSHTLCRIVRIYNDMKRRMVISLAIELHYHDCYIDPVFLYLTTTPWKLVHEYYRLKLDTTMPHDRTRRPYSNQH
jgi:DNA-directed RNA polymerase delta subunit